MISNKIGHRLDPYIYRVFQTVFGNRGNPNVFTLIGFFATVIASAFILADLWTAAASMIVLSGLFDLFDGALARKIDKVTPFGGFLDSVLDRYSDLSLLLAVLIYYLMRGKPLFVVLSAVISIGTSLISYTRARAEAANIPCDIGLMERAERIILLSAGVLFDWLGPVLWILAVLTHVTVVQRIFYAWKKSNAVGCAPKTAKRPAPVPEQVRPRLEKTEDRLSEI
jgi:CDP-diacylglycerol---glycerol-3-phosphate 3-phosphatidyltransferase